MFLIFIWKYMHINFWYLHFLYKSPSETDVISFILSVISLKSSDYDVASWGYVHSSVYLTNQMSIIRIFYAIPKKRKKKEKEKRTHFLIRNFGARTPRPIWFATIRGGTGWRRHHGRYAIPLSTGWRIMSISVPNASRRIPLYTARQIRISRSTVVGAAATVVIILFVMRAIMMCTVMVLLKLVYLLLLAVIGQ